MVDRLTYGLGEHVVAAVFSNDGTLGFALGDGSLRLIKAEAKEPITGQLHDGAILFARPHPKLGFLTAGDDGRLVASDGEGKIIDEAKGKGWPSAMAVDRERGRIAVAFSRAVKIFDSALTLLGERQAEATVQGLAFEPNGRRLGAAHKDGATLWPVEGKGDAQLFKWKGAHSGLTWSPDRRFIVSTMLENALHGWRIADKADMRMSGYPAKVKSVSWEPRGRWLATSGADVIVLWPFSGPEGPMGKSPREIAGGNGRLCTRVEWHPNQDAIAAGYDDGRVLVHILGQPMARQAAAETGSPVTTLSWAPDGKRLAAGREDGSAVLLAF